MSVGPALTDFFYALYSIKQPVQANELACTG